MLGLYPHELSGGMQQRAKIAIAIALDPSLLVLDEPTTALDASVQCEIIAILHDLRKDHKTSVLLISHDINMIRRSCDRVAVMQSGTVVESGAATEVFDNPIHAYTKALIASIPALNYTKRDGRLAETDGPGLPAAAQNEDAGARKERQIAIACKSISHSFGSQPVLHDDLDIARAKPSADRRVGSGKSTLVRSLLACRRQRRIGQLFGRMVVPRVEKGNRRTARVQMVFQSPDRTLNPRQRIGGSSAVCCARLAGLRRSEVRARVSDLLQSVRPPAPRPSRSRDRYPAASGTGGHRTGFAGALKVVVLTTHFGARRSVQRPSSTCSTTCSASRTTYLFISHDLRVVRWQPTGRRAL